MIRPKRSNKYFTPALAGILGAAQLSTACLILWPSSSTDFLLTGAIGPYLVWSVPVGAVLGTGLGWVFLWLKEQPHAWRERRNSWFYAIAGGFVCAPMAPGFLGLGPATTTQLWQNLAILSVLSWACQYGAAQLERRGLL